MESLSSIWPTRTAINGVPLGDAWTCEALPTSGPNTWESILPLHNLTQWLAYSLMQPMQSLLNMYFAGTELLTGLPEYRNGGLFVDLGVLTLKENDMARGLANYGAYCKHSGIKVVEVAPMFEASDDVIVEWRGLTVALLDKLLEGVNEALRPELDGHEMTLAQLLEAGSWKVRTKDMMQMQMRRGLIKFYREVGRLPKSTGQTPKSRRFWSKATERYSKPTDGFSSLLFSSSHSLTHLLYYNHYRLL
jgi:hypothetical protein